MKETKIKYYGVPYMGGKNRIAKEIIEQLPPADTFVDLFAGGCAVAGAAMMSGKYKNIIINDITNAPQLWRDAINGKYRDVRRSYGYRLIKNNKNTKMTKNEIIVWMYDEKIVELASVKYKAMIGDLWDDFLQENFLIYLEMPEDKILGLYDRGELKSYVYRIAHNQATNHMSKFHRTQKNKYKTTNLSYEEIEWQESNKNDQYEDF